MLRNTGLSFMTVTALWTGLCVTTAIAADKPNIVVILADTGERYVTTSLFSVAK